METLARYIIRASRDVLGNGVVLPNGPSPVPIPGARLFSLLALPLMDCCEEGF